MREKDACIAEWMGWPYRKDSDLGEWWVLTLHQITGDQLPLLTRMNAQYGYVDKLPCFTADLVAICLVEDEVARRNLHLRYAEVLDDLVTTIDDLDEESGMLTVWRIIRATPDQRCEAVYCLAQAASDREAGKRGGQE